MWEAVADETKLSLLDVLLNWIESFLLGDLKVLNQYCFEAKVVWCSAG